MDRVIERLLHETGKGDRSLAVNQITDGEDERLVGHLSVEGVKVES